MCLETTKLFMTGRGRTIRLSEAYRLEAIARLELRSRPHHAIGLNPDRVVVELHWVAG